MIVLPRHGNGRVLQAAEADEEYGNRPKFKRQFQPRIYLLCLRHCVPLRGAGALPPHPRDICEQKMDGAEGSCVDPHQRPCEILRVKGGQVINLFPHPDGMDRQAEFVGQRHQHATLGGAVEFGHDKA